MKDLSLQARIYIWAVILSGGFLLAWDIFHTDWSNLWMIVSLSVVASVFLILKVEGTTSRSHYNISFFIYAFTLILLGPSATMVVILVSNVVEWVRHKYKWYIQSFNLGMYFITVQCTSLVYQLVNPEQSLFDARNVIALILAMATFTFVNHLLVGMVVWLARGESLVKSGIFDFLPLVIDFTLLAMGATGALLWMVSPYAVVFAALPIYLIYSTLKVPALERKTETDAKTGLYNDQFFQRTLQSELERANRFDRPLTVVMADMDLLRNINNTYGHLAGDEVLIGVAKILKESVRDVDTVARFGGEEFAILMPETTPEEIFHRIEAVRSKIQDTGFTVETSVSPIHATLSFGVAGRTDPGPTPKELIHQADTALYHAKLNGRNRAYIYTPEGYQQLSQITGVDGEVREAHPDPVEHQPEEQPDVAVESPTPPTQPETQLPLTNRKAKLPQSWLPAYICALLLASSTLFVILYNPAATTDWLGLASFAIVLGLAEWYSVDIHVRDTSVSTSAALIMAGTLLFGPLGCLVLSLDFAMIAKVKHSSKWSRFLFNTANQLLAGLLCYTLVLLSGAAYSQWSVWAQFLLALAASGIFFITTTTAITMAMYLDAGMPILSTWKEKFSWLAPYYLAMGLIALTLTSAYLIAGVIGIGVIIIPLAILRFSQKQYIDRTRGMVNELKQKNETLVEKANEINLLNEGLLNALAEVIDMREPHVLGHSQQVTHYSVQVATRMGLPPEQVESIRKASLLHDVGKLGIPESILRKPGRLTREEFEIIKAHPILGANILAASQSLRSVIPVVRHHHERYDGKGYPDGLKGESIPLEARIVALADAVDSMVSDRPYRKALDYTMIVEEIQTHAGVQFDPQVVDVFLEIWKEEGNQLLVNSTSRIAKLNSIRTNLVEPISAKLLFAIADKQTNP